MSLIVKIGKQGKKLLRKLLPAPMPQLSAVRRIEQIKTDRRIVAMTFDDGPSAVPCSPDLFDGKPLTEVILDTLAEFHAHGTFDVIGDTSENYPDKEGSVGTADWSGIRYDHYPAFGRDALGGAGANPELIGRMLREGHQITNHGYRHVLFGKKPFVYGKRSTFHTLSQVTDDLKRLHSLMQNSYGYTVTMARPPHYVDRIGDGFTSYDAYALMNYQYLAASYDGAGWLPVSAETPEASYAAEVDAMVRPMETLLAQDPDALCGQIIFQKDGCNMAKRTPVATGLRKQLELLSKYGYQVVTVNELLAVSPFADVGADDPDFEKLCRLCENRIITYSDNRLRLDQRMTKGELALLLAPKDIALKLRREIILRTGKTVPTAAGAFIWCAEQGYFHADDRMTDAVASLPGDAFTETADFTRRSVYRAYREDA